MLCYFISSFYIMQFVIRLIIISQILKIYMLFDTGFLYFMTGNDNKTVQTGFLILYTNCFFYFFRFIRQPVKSRSDLKEEPIK